MLGVEGHITFTTPGWPQEAIERVKKYIQETTNPNWHFSEIIADPVLGQASFYYATTFWKADECDLQKCLTQLCNGASAYLRGQR